MSNERTAALILRAIGGVVFIAANLTEDSIAYVFAYLFLLISWWLLYLEKEK